MLSILLTTVLLIIGFGGIDNAQCAWVLWESRSGDGSLHWQVEDAFPSYEKCKQAQQISCERWKNLMQNDNIGNKVLSCPDYLFFSFKDHSHPMEFSYKCLPDTIDPRK